VGALAASASGSWWFRRRNPERSGALTRVLLAGVEVLVEGQVQGVGYRAFALRRARDRGLTGYTLNLPDGRVKVRVEGNRQTIDLYVHDLEVGPPLARVDRVTVTPVTYTGHYRDFAVRFSEA
jgi:acylphosphatase